MKEKERIPLTQKRERLVCLFVCLFGQRVNFFCSPSLTFINHCEEILCISPDGLAALQSCLKELKSFFK